jgi:hypothetical protein
VTWKNALTRTVTTASGETFKTLGDARDFVLAQEKKKEWLDAAGKLVAAAESGDQNDIDAATLALENALLVDGSG